MSKDYRLVAGVLVQPAQLFNGKLGAGSWQPLAVVVDYAYTLDQVFFLSGDSGDVDIIEALNTCLDTMTGLSAVVFSIDKTSGLVSVYNGTASTVTISSRASGSLTPTANNSDNVWAYLFPALALADTWLLSIAAGATYTSARVHGGGLYPRVYSFDDIPARVERSGQVVSDGGKVSTMHFATLYDYHLKMRLTGAYPRGELFSEWGQMQSFLDYAGKGIPCRLYPDRTVTNAVSETYPYGYWEGVLDPEDASWRPEPASGNWYSIWDKKLVFHQHVAPTPS